MCRARTRKPPGYGSSISGWSGNGPSFSIFDIGAVIYFLRKVIWTVPDFTVDRYRHKLRELHERIEADGPFVAHAVRVLVEARKPD